MTNYSRIQMAQSYAGFIVFYSWCSNSLPRPPSKRAVALALINASEILPSEQAPQAHCNHAGMAANPQERLQVQVLPGNGVPGRTPPRRVGHEEADARSRWCSECRQLCSYTFPQIPHERLDVKPAASDQKPALSGKQLGHPVHHSWVPYDVHQDAEP